MHPLIFGILLNVGRGQDLQTAARNAAIGRLVKGATSGVANPIVRAVVSTQLTSEITNHRPATPEAIRNSMVGAAIRNIAAPVRDHYDDDHYDE
jgi:hypothetical protein